MQKERKKNPHKQTLLVKNQEKMDDKTHWNESL